MAMSEKKQLNLKTEPVLEILPTLLTLSKVKRALLQQPPHTLGSPFNLITLQMRLQLFPLIFME
jgi:hypothetical protein